MIVNHALLTAFLTVCANADDVRKLYPKAGKIFYEMKRAQLSGAVTKEGAAAKIISAIEAENTAIEDTEEDKVVATNNIAAIDADDATAIEDTEEDERRKLTCSTEVA